METAFDGSREAKTRPVSKTPYVIKTVLGDGRKVISFGPGDHENPFNWPFRMKCWITLLGIFQLSNSAFSSSMPAGAVKAIADEFGYPTSSPVLSLPISMFIAGYVVGPLFLSPLSEFFGRKKLTIFPLLLYNIWTLACAVAPNMTTLVIFRFMSGIAASAPASITGGICADIWGDPVARGKCIYILCATPMIGPALAPIVSGFVSPTYLTWRFCFWILLIIGILILVPQLWLLPETFGPALLVQKAKKLREETGDDTFVAPAELEDRSIRRILRVAMTRPLEMLFTEAIVGCVSLYLAFVYGTFYMSFQSYPIIFQDIYGFSPGYAGLAFLPLCVGFTIACLVGFSWDEHLHRMSQQGKLFTDEYRRMPLAVLGGAAFIIALFWLGWTGTASIHWIIPMLSGIFFGLGLALVLMASLNYTTDAYRVYSASALGASSMSRSVFGAALPIAAKQMYAQLGVAWATTVLGFIAVGLGCIPFIFMKYGYQIRARSKFCQYLKAIEEQENVDEEYKAPPAQPMGGEAQGEAITGGFSGTTTVAVPSAEDLGLQRITKVPAERHQGAAPRGEV